MRASNRQLDDGTWHKVDVVRNRKRGNLQVSGAKKHWISNKVIKFQANEILLFNISFGHIVRDSIFEAKTSGNCSALKSPKLHNSMLLFYCYTLLPSSNGLESATKGMS